MQTIVNICESPDYHPRSVKPNQTQGEPKY